MRSRLYQMIEQDTGHAGASMGLPALRHWQLARLNESIRHARRSRFYQDKLAAFGQLESLNQLAALPFTTEADLQCGLEEFLCISPNDVARIVTLATSGSTGAPKRIAFSEKDLAATLRFFYYGMQELAAPGQRVMIALPGTAEFGVPHLLAEALAQLGATPLRYGAILDIEDAVQFMKAHRPHCIVGLPIQVLGLATRVAHLPKGSAPWPQTVLLTADTVAPSITRRIERDFQCKAFNHYGSTEMGYGGAVECSIQQQLHLRENDLLFEVVDPESCAPLPPGCKGELVFTTLRRQAMPLIRYRTGDIATLISAPCACGSPFPRITAPYRRNGSAIRAGGTEIGLLEMDDCVFSIEGIVDYRLHLLPQKALKLELWLHESTNANRTIAQLCATPLLRQLAGCTALQVSPAPGGTPLPCTQGKRLFRASNPCALNTG